MSANDLEQSRCPDAYTLLAFAVGSAISAAYIGVRWLAIPLAKHHGLI